MDIYKAQNEQTIIGTQSQIAKKLRVSRQAINKAIRLNNKVNGYSISFLYSKIPKRKTKKDLFDESVELLKRARIIIDEENEILCESGEYANIGIIEDIDRFIENLTATNNKQ